MTRLPQTRQTLDVNGKQYRYHSIATLAPVISGLDRLPYSMKVLLENVIRNGTDDATTLQDAAAFQQWIDGGGRARRELAYRPARVLMQDFTGVPAIVDLAAMRDAMRRIGGDPQKINPLTPVDLVIDHSVMVDHAGNQGAFKKNTALEFSRNGERYEFLRWGAGAFSNFRVVPPGTGICHQVNIEYLAQVIWEGVDAEGHPTAYPDTVVGTDSHTTMVNGLGVLGWGVGGIEAEAAMLGQPVSLLLPEVVGFKLTGRLREGVIATDLVLRIVEMLRQHGVVGKFVEFYGNGLSSLSTADRSTIANMAPEYGATCGIFPIDAEVIRYLRFTGRPDDVTARVEAYAKAQGMWLDSSVSDDTDSAGSAGSAGSEDSANGTVFSSTLTLDLGSIVPSLAGPKRPQDRIALPETRQSVTAAVKALTGRDVATSSPSSTAAVAASDAPDTIDSLADGSVVIAAITSCTNTSNPVALIAAGLLARKALARGLMTKPWVKTSLAPGSQVVTDYLERAGLQADLDALGFNLVGYGCTTCIGNSGPLLPAVAARVEQDDLAVCAVLSGNRNFEGRVNPQVKANYLASPHLCVAFALAGTMLIDLDNDPIGKDTAGNDVMLKDIWPSTAETNAVLEQALTPEMFRHRYGNVFLGPEEWQAISAAPTELYTWQDSSTYVQNPPYFDQMTSAEPPVPQQSIENARVLAILGDSVTTDHISPAGSFAEATPAGKYLTERQVRKQDFNSFGARRGNHQVMMRGTFGNIRIRNAMVPGVEGGVTMHVPSGRQMSIYDAAMAYAETETPLVVLAGKEYGTGSSRDWAAKGTRLLGVHAVIAESFERIHRSNLVGMGVLPLEFTDGDSVAGLKLTGDETIDIAHIDRIEPGGTLAAKVTRPDGSAFECTLRVRIDTADEKQYYEHGGILHYVLRSLHAA